MATKINIIANTQSEEKVGNIGEKSLKSLRTYQLGVVYKDEYGRETPVFTNEDASFTIDKNFSNTKNAILASVKNDPPSWVDSYKFFIKETSNEYYNAVMDRWYDADDGNIWLSFPSAERNKIKEDTYITLKKKATVSGGNNRALAVQEDARYRVIDVKNEAPLDIKTYYDSYGEDTLTIASAEPGATSVSFDFDGSAANEWDASVFYDKTLVPVDGTSGTLEGDHMPREGVTETGFIGWPIKDLAIKITSDGGTQNTGWLDVSGMYKDGDLYVKLAHALKGDANESTGGITEVVPDGTGTVQVNIAKKIVKNKKEFDGRFFVKIHRDNAINNYIRSVGNPVPRFEIKETMKVFSLTVGTSNSDEGFWSTMSQRWFIDNASRAQTGDTGWPGDQGYDGPWENDDGYGIKGNGPGKRTGAYSGAYEEGANWELRCTMELGYQRIRDDENMGFDTSNNSSTDMDFMNKISTKGTLFRWKEDPFQHIYEITEVKNSLDGDTNGRGIINWSSTGSAKKNSFNKSARLYIKFKTYGWRKNDDQASGGVYEDFLEQGEKNKYPFNYKNAYTPDSGISSNATVAGYGIWDPTKKGYGKYSSTPGASLGYHVDASGEYKTINQDGSSHSFDNGAAFHNTIQVIELARGDEEPTFSDNPAIWETEPREDVGLDIYYEASQAYPINLNNKTNELFAPYGSVVTCNDVIGNKTFYLPDNTQIYDWAPTGHGGDTILLTTTSDKVGIMDNSITPTFNAAGVLSPTIGGGTNPDLGSYSDLNAEFCDPTNTNKRLELKFIRQDGSYTTAKVNYFSAWNTGNLFINGTTHIATSGTSNKVLLKLDRNLSSMNIKLPYFNCYTFGNGVESDRIRDDFNAIRLDKGVKASTVIAIPYEEEQRTNGLIYSGIYNSSSGVNNLNQFIQAEKITKDVNPSYGSIQKLKQRDEDLVTFCEDKVLKIIANKDAIYNADGKPQLIATNNVLGQTTSFAGEFGISKNPESFAEESFRMYFTDRQRGKVLRLSQNGITPISDVGMKDYFADNLKLNDTLIGSFDDRKGEYNLTLKNKVGSIKYPGTTISFSEASKGWTSFKSFIQDNGLSLNNDYYTFKSDVGAGLNLLLWKHHNNNTRNNFYDTQYDSHVDVLFNEESEKVKSFGSMKYEGSQAKITKNLEDEEYYNNEGYPGWYVESGETDLQSAGEMEFKDKEGKWFSYMKGTAVESVVDLNSKEFSFQGIDTLSVQLDGCTDRAALNYCPSCTNDDGSCLYSRWYCYDYNCLEDNDGSSLYATEIECQANCVQGATIYGCTNPLAINYDPTATDDDGSCCLIYGCTTAGFALGGLAGVGAYPDINGHGRNAVYDCAVSTTVPTIPDPCVFPCVDIYPPTPGVATVFNGFLASNYNPCADCDDDSCITPLHILGCTDPAAANYYAAAEFDDGSCVYVGCTDPTATNYNPLATIDDGSCICAWPHGGLAGGGPVTWQTNYTNYTNPLGGGGQVLVSLTQPGGPYTIELEDPNGTLHPNTFGTTSHVTSLGFAGTITYENMLPGQYVIRATDVNGCEIWMGVVMN